MKDDMKKQFNDAFDDVQSLVPWGPDEPSPTRAIGAQDFIKEIGNKKPKIEADKKEQRSGDAQADRLVEFVFNDPSITLFRDELDVAYAKFTAGGHKEILPIGGSTFKHWLAKSFYDAHKKTLNQNSLATALQTITGRARFDGEAIELHTRAAVIDGAVWYDLADKEWRVVKITADGWEMIDNPPIIFKRQQYQAPQVLPVSGGNIQDILQFINITDEDQKLLFLVLLVSYFIPSFPHPIAYIYGPQGSAKSTYSRVKRKLIDPSRIEVLSLPRKEEDLVQVLSHHYMLFFDNVGAISDSVSDLLCRAVTGSGFSKRQLYTNDEDIIYSIQANIGINCINLSSSKPDLLERSMLFELRRVEKTERRKERELWEEFERKQPYMLGAIFDVIARALALYPSIQVDSLPRMADFTLWGCAISEAMGYSKETFLKAYFGSIDSQNDEVLNEHMEAELLREFMADKEVWSGSASELLEHLRTVASTTHVAESELPKAANKLSEKLNTLKTNLEEVGLKIAKGKGKKRTITIHKVSANIVETVGVAPSVSTEQSKIDDTGDDRWFVSLSESSTATPIEIGPKDGKDDTDDSFVEKF